MVIVSAPNTSEWDQRQLFNKRLHELLSSADVHSIYENYNDWFDCLRGVRRMIHHFLNKEEEIKVDELMRKARRWAKTKGVANPELIQDVLDELHTLLYDLSHKYQLLIPINSDDSSGFMKRL